MVILIRSELQAVSFMSSLCTSLTQLVRNQLHGKIVGSNPDITHNDKVYFCRY